MKLPVFTVDTALPAGTYSWRVRRASTPAGNPGPWRELTDLSALPTFDRVGPRCLRSSRRTDQVIDHRQRGLLFTWSGQGVGATQYHLESSKTIGFGTLLEHQVTVMTAWAPTNAYPDSVPVYWRVRALDSANNTLSTSSTCSVHQGCEARPSPSTSARRPPR